MLEAYKPHTHLEAVGVWLCSAAKRPSKRSALVIIITPHGEFAMVCTNDLSPNL